MAMSKALSDPLVIGAISCREFASHLLSGHQATETPVWDFFEGAEASYDPKIGRGGFVEIASDDYTKDTVVGKYANGVCHVSFAGTKEESEERQWFGDRGNLRHEMVPLTNLLNAVLTEFKGSLAPSTLRRKMQARLNALRGDISSIDRPSSAHVALRKAGVAAMCVIESQFSASEEDESFTFKNMSVHAGFVEVFTRLFPATWRWLQDGDKLHQVRCLRLSGHSRGGSLAELLAIMLVHLLEGLPQIKIECVVISSPKLGNLHLASYANLLMEGKYMHYCHFSNSGDIVPLVPPHASFCKWSSSILLDGPFKDHVGFFDHSVLADVAADEEHTWWKELMPLTAHSLSTCTENLKLGFQSPETIARDRKFHFAKKFVKGVIIPRIFGAGQDSVATKSALGLVLEQGGNQIQAIHSLREGQEQSFRDLHSEIEQLVAKHQKMSLLTSAGGALRALKYYAESAQHDEVEKCIQSIVKVSLEILHVITELQWKEIRELAAEVDLTNAVIAAMVMILQIRITQGMTPQTAQRASLLVRDFAGVLCDLNGQLDFNLARSCPRLSQLDVLLWTVYSMTKESDVVVDEPDCDPDVTYEELTISQLLPSAEIGVISKADADDMDDVMLDITSAEYFSRAGRCLFKSAVALRATWKLEMEKVPQFAALRKEVTHGAYGLKDGLIPLSSAFVNGCREFFQCFPETIEIFEEDLPELIKEVEKLIAHGRVVEELLDVMLAHFDNTTKEMDACVDDLNLAGREAAEQAAVARSSASEVNVLKIREGNRYGFLHLFGEVGKDIQSWMVKDKVQELHEKVDAFLKDVRDREGDCAAAAMAVDIIRQDLKPSVAGFLEAVSDIIKFFEVFNANLRGVHNGTVESRDAKVDGTAKRGRFYRKVSKIAQEIKAACGSYMGAVKLFNLQFKLMDVEQIPGENALLWFQKQKLENRIELDKVKDMLKCYEGKQEWAKPVLAILEDVK